MPKPARTPDRANTPAAPSSRDIALKALIRAVALPVLVVVINTARDGWSTSSALMVMGIGVPLLWIALFVADYYIQPAVERRTGRRRNSAGGTAQNRGPQKSPKSGPKSQNGPRNRNSGPPRGKSQQNKSQQGKSEQGKSQRRK